MSEQDPPRIAKIYRYPVKGLSGEALSEVNVTAGETLPFDRAFAIENGRGAFNAAAPRHLPKTAFVMLMRHERLALIETRFDERTCVLEIRRAGSPVATGRLDDATGRAVIEQFIAGFLGDGLRGAPRIVAGTGHSFSDVEAKCVSIINLASVREIERVAGQPVEPIRFRGNIYVEGLRPWEEFDWLERKISIGNVRLAPFKRTIRCAATAVNPQTARRDINIPRLLSRAFGHADCGIYAHIATGGRLAQDMEIRVGGNSLA